MPIGVEVLQAAGLGRARALIVAFDNLRAAERLLALVRHLHPEMPVLLRARDQVDADALKVPRAPAWRFRK